MTLKIALGVFVGIVVLIVAFALAIPHANREKEEAPQTEEPSLPEFTFEDSYSRGEHTISGSVMAPTPCTAVTADASVASGTPQTISVHLEMPTDDGICLQVVTLREFEVSLTAEEAARIELYINGRLASSTMPLL